MYRFTVYYIRKISGQILKKVEKITRSYMLRRTPTTLLVLFISGFIAFSCNNMPNQHWLNAVPGYAPAVILHQDDPSIQDAVRFEYMTFIEDLTNSAIPVAAQLEEIPEARMQLKAIAAIPTRADNWRPLFITDAGSDFLSNISGYFYQEFAENEYDFANTKVHILHTEDRTLYAAQLRNWVIFSESSYAVEEGIRTYLGERPSFDFTDTELAGSNLLLNFPHLDRWVTQKGAVRYRPMIKGMFEGTQPSLTQVSTGGGDDRELRMEGTIPTENPYSTLLTSFHSEPGALVLDRYISGDAATFSITSSTPPESLPSDFEAFSRLDSLLIEEPEIYEEIAATLNPRTAFVAFSDPDDETAGEHIYLRHLNNTQEIYRIFQELANNDYVRQDDEIFYVQSEVLAKLIGGPMTNFEDFYLGTTWEGAVLAQRSGLIQRVRTERSQRRVMYYDDNYTAVRDQHPDNVSAFFYARNQDLFDYLQPMLNPNHRIGAITSRSDIMAMSITQNSSNELGFIFDTYRTEETDTPYRERWVHPLQDADLTGDPVAANTGNGSRDDIFFATDAGRVIGLGSDGTPVFNASTGGDTPIGSPIIYDWYGNNQKMVMIGAGNKIYAWNNDGVSLPNFPIELNEELSAPISVGDVARNGMTELIVATADRQLHVLDGRGQNISGWPQSTNSSIRSQPKHQQLNGEWGVWAFADNGIHAWTRNGDRREGFPIFGEAPFFGEPTFHGQHLLASGADGHLYAIGQEKLFDDTLAAESPNIEEEADDEELIIQSLQVSNAALAGNAQIDHLRVRSEEDEVHDEEMLVVADENGSIYAFNLSGELRFTESMGQPASQNHSPFIHDLGDTGNLDALLLADSGRIYAWDLYNAERITQLPTTGMNRLLVTDLYQDGRTELIAHTSGGIRAWTISRIRDDDPS